MRIPTRRYTLAGIPCLLVGASRGALVVGGVSYRERLQVGDLDSLLAAIDGRNATGDVYHRREAGTGRWGALTASRIEVYAPALDRRVYAPELAWQRLAGDIRDGLVNLERVGLAHVRCDEDCGLGWHLFRDRAIACQIPA